MCIFSTCGQLVYGVLMVGCLALTSIATFTNSWADLKDIKGTHVGIMPFACVYNSEACGDWYRSSSNWRRAVAVMMCIAIALEIIALAWNLFTCFACCCKKWLIHPLSLFSLLILVFLLASIITFACSYKNLWSKAQYTNHPQPELGWSFWMAIGALCLSAADVLVGGITVFLGRHHL